MRNDQVNILLVDDEVTVCDLLSEELTEHGCACVEAYDGETALKKLAEQEFAVVILDIKLPGMSGIEVLNELRRHYPNVSTIIMTAVNDVETAVRAMKLGAADYIIKPFDLARVAVSVDTAIASTLEASLASEYTSEIDAIAFGVEQSRELFDGHYQHVTSTTADIAKRLGIPEPEVVSWAANRTRNGLQQQRRISTSVEKLMRSPLAQAFIGVSAAGSNVEITNETRN